MAHGQNFYLGFVVSIQSDNSLIVGARGTEKNYRLEMKNGKYYAKVTFSENAVRASRKIEQERLANHEKKVDESSATGGSARTPMRISSNETVMVPVSSARFYEELRKLLGEGDNPQIEVYGRVNEQEGIVHAKHVTLHVTLDEPI